MIDLLRLEKKQVKLMDYSHKELKEMLSTI
jgi:hypothetical protein